MTASTGLALAAPEPAPAGGAADGAVATAWQELVGRVPEALQASRHFLFGDRGPQSETCVVPGKPIVRSSPDGGVGMRLAELVRESEAVRTSPAAEFHWGQNTLKPFVARMRARNAALLPTMIRLATVSAALSDGLASAAAWPGDLVPAKALPEEGWFAYTAANLNHAVAGRDLPAARRWADELASALFAAADLHHWVDCLTQTQLARLEFQAHFRDLHERCFIVGDQGYAPKQGHNLPAGGLALASVYNFAEVERQAEWLFGLQDERTAVQLDGGFALNRDVVASVPAAVWIPPHVRGAFAELRANLSDTNRDVWDRAARTPFERSYLVNMLYRYGRARMLNAAGEVLARFDRAHPRAGVDDLMDVLFYRSGSPSGGLPWGDRFDPRLMEASARLSGTDEEVLLGAMQIAHAFMGDWSRYDGVDTLAEAMAQRRLDCIVATDLIGALYRNAGRTDFSCVRLTAGNAMHSLAAADVDRDGARTTVTVDGIDLAQRTAALWPSAYLRPYVWPKGYPGRQGDIQAVERFGRGLDNYIWLEGYVVDGPEAGRIVRGRSPFALALPPARRARTEPEAVTPPARPNKESG